MKKILLTLLLLAGISFAQAPIPLIINSRAPTAPGIDPYQASRTVYRATFMDGTNPVSLTSLSPWMSWSSNSLATSVSTASMTVVSSAGGIVDFTFTASALNPTFGPGRYLYEVGLRATAGITVYRQGVLTLRGSPYAAGVSPAAWTTNAVNWGTINWTSLPTTLAGYGIVDGVDLADLLAVSGLVVNAQSDVDAHKLLTGSNVHGLGTASTHAHGDYATAAQGALAATALQSEADTNALAQLSTHAGLTGTNAHGLGSASLSATSAFATSAQGATADVAYANSVEALSGVTMLSNRITATEGATNALNTSVVSLKISTNALHVRAEVLEGATNSLQAQVTALSTNAGTVANIIALQGATNALDAHVSSLESATNAMAAQITAGKGATNTLNTQVVALQGATGTLNTATNSLQTQVTALKSSTNILQTQTTALQGATNTQQVSITALQSASNSLTTRAATLETATNSMTMRIVATESSTNALNTRVGTAEVSTNYLSGQVTALKTATNNLQVQATAAGAATNALQIQAAALQGATSSINTSVTALKGATNSITSRVATLENAGYLTASTNLFTSVTVADRSQLGTNIAGLTQGTYTGSLTSVSYTGTTALVAASTYAWGFTKANSYGTSTLSIATFSLTKTAAGATSNYFTFSGTDSNLVLRLDGDGSSKSDVTGVYVQQITGGVVNVAGALNVSGPFSVAGKTPLYSGDAGTGTNLSAYNNDTLFVTTTVTNGVNARIDSLTNGAALGETAVQPVTLAAHTTNTANPHAVTAAQVGAVSTDNVDHLSIPLTMTNLVNAYASTGSASYVDRTLTITHGTNTGGGAGTLTNIISSDGSVSISTPGGPQPNLSATNAVAKWSGYNATQQVSWVEIVIATNAANISTNLTLTSTDANPMVTGTCAQITDANGYACWSNSGYYVRTYNMAGDGPPYTPCYLITHDNSGSVIGNDSDPYWVLTPLTNIPTGDYLAVNAPVPWDSFPHNSTGTITVVYSIITNSPTTITTNAFVWRAGYNPTNAAWQIARDDVVIQSWYAASNVVSRTTYGDGSGWTNLSLPATNAIVAATGALNTAVGNLNSATGALNTATNYLNTIASAALPKAGGMMSGPLTNTHGFFGNGAGLTNLAAPTATNSDALGNIAAATWVSSTNNLSGRMAAAEGATNVLNSRMATVETATNALNTQMGNAESATNALNTRVGNLEVASNAINAVANAALPASSTNALAVTALQITGLSGDGVVPVGAIMQYIASNSPAGWLLCNGFSIATNTYPALFAVIGTQYGSTNAAWFNLPDLRGRVPVGMGTGTGLTARNLNDVGGTETVVLGIGQIPAHSHVIYYDEGVGDWTGNYHAGDNYKSSYTYSKSTADAGGGGAHSNMPPFVVVNYIIKY